MLQYRDSLPVRWVRRVGQIPENIWSPIAAALILLVPGLIGVISGLMLLVPSLGPTALTQAHTPDRPSAQFYNVVLSHLGAMIASFAVVILFGLASTPSVFEAKSLSVARVLATFIAVILALTIEFVLQATHPPAVSTTLLVSLGSIKPTLRETLFMIVAILLVGVVGESVRRIRLAGLARAGDVGEEHQALQGDHR